MRHAQASVGAPAALEVMSRYTQPQTSRASQVLLRSAACKGTAPKVLLSG